MERPVSRRRRALSSGDRVLNENAVEGENACASPGPEARRQPTFLPTLAKSILDVFYREVEVTGAHKVRAEGALVVVGNHGAALLDPALFTGYLPRAPRFLAKSTLWKNPAVLPFLRLGAAIPVYRRQDPGVDPADNMATFRICHEVLAARGVIGLFPEGKSHHEPSLTALKTGVARIVLQAMTRFPGLDVEIVPVGLTFDDKTRFRSRALLTVGDPIRPAEILAARRRELAEVAEVEEAARPETADADPEQVEALIQAIRRGLLEVTLNYPSWEEARLIERAAEIFSRPDPRPPAETSLGRSFESRQVFIEGYQDLAECFPEEVREVAEEVRSYQDSLELHDVSDAQVQASYPPSVVWRFTLESLALLAWRLPLGVLGTVLNAPPFWLVGVIARRFSTGPDSDATYKLLPSIFLYPLTWLAQAAAAAAFLGSWWGLLAFFLGPIGGFFAIRLHQRADIFLRHARAFLLWRGGSRRLLELRERRRALLGSVERLAARYRGEPPS